MSNKADKQAHTLKVKRYKADDYAKAVTDAGGLITVAARRLGVDRGTVYNAVRKHKKVAAALDDARERTTDLAESKLISQISEGNTTAIIFYLKTQAKNRGYVEQTQVQHSGSLTVEAVARMSDEEIERLAAERGLPELE